MENSQKSRSNCSRCCCRGRNCVGDMRKKVKMLYTSLNSFKDENPGAYVPSHAGDSADKKISWGETFFSFLQEDNVTLAEGFFV